MLSLVFRLSRFHLPVRASRPSRACETERPGRHGGRARANERALGAGVLEGTSRRSRDEILEAAGHHAHVTRRTQDPFWLCSVASRSLSQSHSHCPPRAAVVQRRRPAGPIAAWLQLGPKIVGRCPGPTSKSGSSCNHARLGPMGNGQPRPTDQFGSSCDHAIIGVMTQVPIRQEGAPAPTMDPHPTARCSLPSDSHPAHVGPSKLSNIHM